jgi:hypothetical protein
MSKVLLRKALAPVSIMAAGLFLAGCGSMTTYGTGKTPGAQTLEDIGGIVSLGGKRHDAVDIDYKQRPGVVEPPSTAILPPPKSKQEEEAQLAMSGDWPKDPDEADKKMRESVQEAAASGEDLKFTVPGGNKAPTSRAKQIPHSRQLYEEKREGSLDVEEQKKLFADLKRAKTGSVDENGNPVRKYLTEPPSDYRTPDPDAPLEITEKKKKTGFKWPDLWPF